eukprot:8248426-Pyramimonas_sp.AAC.1
MAAMAAAFGSDSARASAALFLSSTFRSLACDRAKARYALTADQSDAGSAGICSRRTNHTQVARVYSHAMPAHDLCACTVNCMVTVLRLYCDCTATVLRLYCDCTATVLRLYCDDTVPGAAARRRSTWSPPP